MTPDNKKYMLNRSSHDTKDNKKEIIFHILDPDTAEVQKTHVIIFHLEQTQYFFRKSKGFNEMFRITRFQPTLFQVDRVISAFFPTKVIYNYDIIDKENPKDILDNIDFVGVFFDAQKTQVNFSGEIMNLADVTEIILQSVPSTEKAFLKAFSMFVMTGSGALLKEALRVENVEFFEKLNLEI